MVKLARVGTLSGVAAAAVIALAVLQGSSAQPAPGVVLSRDAESRPPATQPSKSSAAPGAGISPVVVRPLPDDFQPLLQRSLFSAKRETPEREAELAEAKLAAASSREASLVLCGVAQQGNDFTALIEDVAGHRVNRLTIGDTVGRGRLTRVDLDGIEYEVAGRIRRVRVGDDLTGSVAAIADDASPAPVKTARASKKKQKPEENPALPAQPGEGARAAKDEPPKKKEKGSLELKIKGANVVLPNHID